MFWNNSKTESTDTSKTINGLTMTMTMALFDVKEASLWSIMVAALPLILLTWLILVLLKKVSKKNFSVQVIYSFNFNKRTLALKLEKLVKNKNKSVVYKNKLQVPKNGIKLL